MTVPASHWLAKIFAPGKKASRELRRHQKYLHILNQFSVEMIGLTSKEALYWHVARQVVGRLGFEDCVVYELVPSSNMLIQRAAIGAKNPRGEDIANRLTIPLGRGITGAVATSRQPLIVADLREDKRYLIDMKPARSEICVPIVCDDKVIGVIDCEDVQPNTFNLSHLEILTTVASLLCSKLAQCDVHAELEASNRQLNREIQERVQAQDALREHLDALEDIVRQRTTELQNSLDELRRETEERRLAELSLRENQAMLMRSEKMASIGNLIAGINHEINNPVAYVSSNLHVLEEYVGDLKLVLSAQSELVEATLAGRSDVRECANSAQSLRGAKHVETLLPELDNLLNDTREGVQRVQRIVADLRDYTYQRGDEVEQACINDLLERTLRLAVNEIKYKAQVICECAELPTIPCFPERLGQVFLNLLVNAAQAIESQGTIRIQTQHCDNWIIVSITDTGCGIPEANLGHIFDPFFTTKEVGEGTGLGLHIVHTIIDLHGGIIHAESEVGSGTTFTIRLPRSLPETARDRPRIGLIPLPTNRHCSPPGH